MALDNTTTFYGEVGITEVEVVFGYEVTFFAVQNLGYEDLLLYLKTQSGSYNTQFTIVPPESRRDFALVTDAIKVKVLKRETTYDVSVIKANSGGGGSVTVTNFPATQNVLVTNQRSPGGALLINDFPIQVSAALGKISGVELWQNFKEASIVSTGRVLFSNTNPGYVLQTTQAQRSIRSTSANDTIGGTGARKVLLNYIRADGSEGFQEIDLAGLSAVTTNSDIMHINSFLVTEFGSGGVAAGVISLYANNLGSGTVICSISLGGWREQSAIFFTPANKMLYLEKLYFVSRDPDGKLYLMQDIYVDAVNLPGKKIFAQVFASVAPDTANLDLDGVVTIIPPFSRFQIEVDLSGGAAARLCYVVLRGWLVTITPP